MMNTSELREKPAEELQKHLLGLLKEQFNLRMQKGMGETPRPHLFRKVSRAIARVKTILNEKGRQS